ncbi:MAG: immunoglobulin domain-containing protein [Opitutaceae bacterium]|nr:immunoglobulin domain-containing protein [Opitutaceae bacterium]
MRPFLRATSLLARWLVALATDQLTAAEAPNSAEPLAIVTLAGQIDDGSADGFRGAASFYGAYAVAVSPDGNAYVSDYDNNTIRKITPDGLVTTFAGTPRQSGSNDGSGASARFRGPRGVAIDFAGNIYVVDSLNHTIRKITPDRTVSTFAGTAGSPGYVDGTGTAARFQFPECITVDRNQNVYVYDRGNRRVRKITAAGVVSTFSGSGAPGHNDGAAAVATFDNVNGLAAAPDGRLLLAQTSAGIIRVLAPDGTASTFAGSRQRRGDIDGTGGQAAFREPWGLALDDAGNIFIADAGSGLIRKATPQGVVTTVAGSPERRDSVDGLGRQAGFDQPQGVAFDARGNLYVTDYNCVRRSLRVPTVTPLDQNITVRAGTTLRLRYRVSSDFSPTTVTIFHQGSPTERSLVLAEPQDGELATVITPVTASTGGTYTIAVANAAGTTLSRAILVTVEPAAAPPVIVRQPENRTVPAGSSFTVSVTASGEGPFSYQWFNAETRLPGATGPSYTVAAARTSDSGSYFVRVSNAGGTTTSANARITVNAVVPPNPAAPGDSGTLPPSIGLQPVSQSVTAGETAVLRVAATGSGPLSYQWFKQGVALGGATQAALSLGNAQPADSGTYHVVVTGAGGTIASRPAVLDVRPAVPAARLTNLSVRTTLQARQTLIVGLGVEGGPRDVVVRAVGPGLGTFGLGGTMPDPRLELFRNATLIQANDNWPDALAASFAAVGAFPLPSGSRDAAMRQTLDGTISIQARGDLGGAVLLEAYDVGAASAARLVNLSARNHVGTGDQVLITGFSLVGSAPQRLLVRAVGPALAGFGVAGVLADPVLELYSGATVVATNDNWNAEIAPQFAAVGAFALPFGSRDAALLVTLPPGAYTALVRGADGTTGEALVEIYAAP